MSTILIVATITAVLNTIAMIVNGYFFYKEYKEFKAAK